MRKLAGLPAKFYSTGLHQNCTGMTRILQEWGESADQNMWEGRVKYWEDEDEDVSDEDGEDEDEDEDHHLREGQQEMSDEDRKDEEQEENDGEK